MKITNFQLTIQQSATADGYGDNFYIDINSEGLTNISRPYKSIPIEEHLAIEEVIISAIKAHLKLVKQVDNANQALKLEEYQPIEPPVVKTAGSDFDLDAKSAVPQSCALGDGEVSTGAEDKSVPKIVQ